MENKRKPDRPKVDVTLIKIIQNCIHTGNFHRFFEFFRLHQLQIKFIISGFAEQFHIVSIDKVRSDKGVFKFFLVICFDCFVIIRCEFFRGVFIVSPNFVKPFKNSINIIENCLGLFV